MEKELKEKEWMIADQENTHHFKVSDMEAQMENMQSIQQKLQEDFKRKHGELDRLAREREEMLLNTKQVKKSESLKARFWSVCGDQILVCLW